MSRKATSTVRKTMEMMMMAMSPCTAVRLFCVYSVGPPSARNASNQPFILAAGAGTQRRETLHDRGTDVQVRTWRDVVVTSYACDIVVRRKWDDPCDQINGFRPSSVSEHRAGEMIREVGRTKPRGPSRKRGPKCLKGPDTIYATILIAG